MIRIILKESKYGISDRDYGLKHVRFLKMIRGLERLVEEAAFDLVYNETIDSPQIGWNEKVGLKERFANKIWLGIIEQIKPLKTEHILSEVGFGALGGAFRLTNGNILKVGVDSDGSDPDLEWLVNDHIPQQIKKDHFSGRGTANELHVYDSGEIMLPNNVSEQLWSWREVPSYTTFLAWLHEQGLEDAAHEIAYLGHEINDIITEYSRQLDNVVGFNSLYRLLLKNRKNDYDLLRSLDEIESKKLIKAIYDIILRRQNLKDNDSLDLKADNLGVDQHGNFVFFDF